MDSSLTKLSPLAATLVAVAVFATLLLGHIERAEAATVAVTNCNDSGPGSLRHAVFTVQNGDTIDMRALTCGTIVFTRAIRVDQDGLTLVGPGASALALDGNQAGRLFFQPGPGTLSLRSLSLRNGRYAAPWARGGCISTAGNIELRDAWVHDCVAFAVSNPIRTEAEGGGLYALGNVALLRSRVFANRVASGIGAGGGIFARGDVSLIQSDVYDNAVSTGGSLSGNVGGVSTYGRLTLFRSSVLRNRAARSGGAYTVKGLKATYSSISDNVAGYVGGVESWGDFELYHSTVSGNRADGVGGIWVTLWSATHKVVIEDSTISRNVAQDISAGYLVPWVYMNNSTIAFNEETPAAGSGCRAALFIDIAGTFQSSIVASNSCSAGPEYDISTVFYEGQSIFGANNIIGSSFIPVPVDTLSVDPRVGPLRDNGGPTLTHALLSDSPAIDRGNNAAGLAYDQRGVGFPRVKGAAADIGSYER
jgi:hypothetical protein